jgi:hypothetical protein
MNLDNPASISRTAYVTEYTSLLRTGLGRFSGVGVSTGQLEVDAWEQTHRACCTDSVGYFSV